MLDLLIRCVYYNGVLILDIVVILASISFIFSSQKWDSSALLPWLRDNDLKHCWNVKLPDLVCLLLGVLLECFYIWFVVALAFLSFNIQKKMIKMYLWYMWWNEGFSEIFFSNKNNFKSTCILHSVNLMSCKNYT